jgi:hypothetical protein
MFKECGMLGQIAIYGRVQEFTFCNSHAAGLLSTWKEVNMVEQEDE